MTGDVLAAVAVPATTANLGPGFDAFGAALSLRATFTAVQRDGPRVISRGSGGGDLPTGDDNLVWRSVVAACRRFGWDVPDVAVEVDSPIPQARGLGSSSAAIVGGIALARVMAGADASVAVGDAAVGDRDLVVLAAELEGHPDNVAPAVHGGLVAAATTDDGVLVTRMAVPPVDVQPVLLVPAEVSLTSEARAALPTTVDVGDAVVQAARAGHVLAGLVGGWPVDPRLAGDRLHEPVRAAALAAGGPLLERLRAAGHHAWLSGAGPSLAVAVPRRAPIGSRGSHGSHGSHRPHEPIPPDGLAAVRAAAEGTGHAVHVLDWDRQGIRSCIPGGCGVAGSPGCTDCPLPSLR